MTDGTYKRLNPANNGWESKNLSLEFKSSSPILGFKQPGDHAVKIDVTHGDAHSNMVKNIKEQYLQKLNVEVIDSSIKLGDSYVRADLAVSMKNNKYALEVKTNYQDFKKSLFQCRTYRQGGYIPYVVVPRQLIRDKGHAIDSIYSDQPDNLPGMLVCDKGTLTQAVRPNYNIQ
mgnify:CR=1 FL=1